MARSLKLNQHGDSRRLLPLRSVLSVSFAACALIFVIGRTTRRNQSLTLSNKMVWTGPHNIRPSRAASEERMVRLLSSAKTNNAQASSSEDTRFQEEAFIQPALFAHPNPKQVAIVSSTGSTGTIGWIEQVLTHTSVETVWIVGDSSERCNSEDLSEREAVLCHSPVVRWIRFEDFVGGLNKSTLDVVFMERSCSSFTHSYDVSAWFEHLSSDGILIKHLGELPSLVHSAATNRKADGHRSVAMTELEKAGFERIIDYDVRYQGTTKSCNYAVAFKSSKMEARWHMTEASRNLEIRKRTEEGPTFSFFDSSFMESIEFPSKASEATYCRENPTEKVCQSGGRGHDPNIQDVPSGFFKVQKSEMGEHSGRGVFATIDIPATSYLGLESASNPLRCGWETTEMMAQLLEHNPIYEGWKGEAVDHYFEGYGFVVASWVSQPNVSKLPSSGFVIVSCSLITIHSSLWFVMTG
jgi:hypothetical protein